LLDGVHRILVQYGFNISNNVAHFHVPEVLEGLFQHNRRKADSWKGGSQAPIAPYIRLSHSIGLLGASFRRRPAR